MKKLNGYTLAEVLTVVLIIGVIAAMTIPALVNKSSDRIDGARVARTVKLFENGMANIINRVQEKTEDGGAVASLSAIQVQDILSVTPEGLNAEDYITDGNNLMRVARGLLGLVEEGDYVIGNISTYSGENVNGEPDEGEGGEAVVDILASTHAYRFTKTVPVLIFQEIGNIADDIGNDDVITRIFIDANGSAGPNQLGKDVFLFGLSNNGTLVPAGSQAYNNFDNSVEVDACAEEPNDGKACAARLMADGWKIKY